jgi:peptide/nickel transport system substrate-binding protein
VTQQNTRPRGGARARRAALAGALSLTVLVTGCADVGREPAPAAQPGFISELVLPSESGGAVQSLENYNPYAITPLTRTWLYEPMMLRDAYTCDYVPWLVTGYETPDPTTLVLQVRDGVTWSDGTPMTADDVVFTMESAKAYPGMDKAGLWSPTFGGVPTAITADGNTVTVTFDAPFATKLQDVLSLTQVLPRHHYGDVGDITQYVDTDPVGTGPFVVGGYNGRRLVLLRNEDHWQADQIKVQQLSLQGTYDANSAALKLRSGALDLYQGDIPNPVRSVRATGVTDFDYSPAGTTVLTPNNERGPLRDVEFRKAMALAIDKDAVARKSTFGVMDAASQTMLKLPLQADQLPPQYADGGYIPHDPAAAEAALDAAGYVRGPDGARTTPEGERISLAFTVQAGYIDYLAMAQQITRDLAQVGIEARQVVTDPNATDAAKKNGDFDLVLDYVGGGCTRAKDLGQRLRSDQITGPDDPVPLLNSERFSDPAVDELVDAYSTATTPEEQAAGLSAITDVFVQQVPVIALTYAPQRLIWSEGSASGWPSDSNRYPTDSPLRIMTELRPYDGPGTSPTSSGQEG